MTEDLDYLMESNLMQNRGTTEVMEDLHESASRYAELVEELEDTVNEYVSAVDRFQRGEISRHELKESMLDYAKINKEVNETFDELIGYQSELEVDYNRIEDDIDQISFMMAQDAVAEEKMKVEEGEGFNEKETALPFMPPGDSFIQEVTHKQHKLADAADRYKAGFLDETFMNLYDAVAEFRDSEVQAEINQFKDADKAEEVMKNPNDSYIGFTSSEGTEDMEAVREEIISKTPRGKRPNSIDEEQLEENSERIKQAKKDINSKENLRYIH